jgi:predicted transcriptional regulator
MSVTEQRTASATAAKKLRNATFSVDDRDMKRLEALAKAEGKGTTVSGMLREAVADYLTRKVDNLEELDAQILAIQEAETKLNQMYAGIRTNQ